MARGGASISPGVGAEGTAARAVVAEYGKKIDTTKDRSPEAKRASHLVERRAKGEKPGEIIAEMRGRIEAGPPPTRIMPAEIAQGIRTEFSQDIRDVDGDNIRETAVGRTKTQENTQAFDLTRKVAEGDFANLTPAERGQVVNQVKSILESSSKMQEAMAHMDPAEREAFYARIAASPLFAEQMSLHYEYFNPNNPDIGPLIDPALMAEYTEAWNDYRPELGTLNVRKAEMTLLQTVKRVYTEAPGFLAKNVPDRTVEINDISNQLQTITQERTELEARLDDPNYVGDRKVDFARFQDLSNEEEYLTGKKDAYQILDARLIGGTPAADIETEINTLIIGPGGTDSRIADKQIEINAAQTEVNNRKDRLQRAIDARLRAEEQLKNKGTRSFQEATTDWLQDQLKSYEEANAELEKSGDHLRTPEGVVEARLMQRWQNRSEGGFLRKAFSKDNVKAITADYNRLMRGDINGIMAELTADLPDNERMALMNNKDLKARVVKNLLVQRMNHGGISMQEVRVLMNTEWGEDAIEYALKSNQKALDAFEKLQDMGVATEGFKAWLRKQSPGNVFAIITALLVGIPATVLAGVVAAPVLGAGAAIAGAVGAAGATGGAAYLGSERS